MVCQASGYYRAPFHAGQGVAQGSPLSAKLLNILVNAVARECFRRLCEESFLGEEESDHLMETFFAVFYIDDAYLASRDPALLQWAIDLIIKLFVHVGLKTNVGKT
jgi:hypothetical protein